MKLENKVSEQKAKIEAINARNRARAEDEKKKREEEVEFLKYQEQHLTKFLKQVTEKSKSWTINLPWNPIGKILKIWKMKKIKHFFQKYEY